MDQIILCNQCKDLNDKELLCDKCYFYVNYYCSNCHEKSEKKCSVCKDARAFLEWDDKRQASANRTDRNHIIHISLEYAENKKMLINPKPDALEELINSNEHETILQAFNCLTETQKRRFIAHCIEGKTYRAVALEEGVNHTKIQKSVEQTRKKLKNFLK